MKNIIVPLFTTLLILSCSKSTEDEFNEVNGNVAEKYVKSVQVIDNVNGNTTLTVNYGEANRVSSITDGSATSFFNYDSSNNLSSINDSDDTFSMSELYQAPYDAFETGQVLEYDDNSNPTKIKVYEDGYGSQLLTGTIIYDANPNPYFYTLKAAGGIAVLDRVDLNFGITDPSIIKARNLFPNNNIRAMIFKDNNGITKYEVQFSYTYGNDKYPLSASVSTLSVDETTSYSLIYTYK
ncbi:MAG: hypothetical protein R2776_03465 [Flavobacteriaceae bacterium]